MRNRTLRVWMISIALLAMGCGYALVGRGSNIPDDAQSVYLAPLRNETTRGEIEQFVTQSIADELVTRRRFVLVRSIEEADAVLRGSITQFRATPVSFDSEGRADEYEITIVANMEFQRTSSDEMLWAADRYRFRANYELEDSTDFVDEEDLALEETAILFAETMVSDLLEGF